MPDPGVENCAPCHPKKHDHCDPCAPKIYESEACGHAAKTCHEFSCMPPIAPVCENLGCHDDVYSSQREVLRKVNDVVGRMNAMNDKACGTFAKLEAISRQNGSYYPERVIKVTEAYSAEDDCPYKITEIRNKDCGCKPVHMQLHIAYNNTTNSELKESIFEASEIELADKMVAAIPVRAGGWFGKVRYQGAPLPGDEQDNLYTVAFTKSGRMKWYKNTVSDDQIRRDKISNSMGVYGVIAVDGQLSSTELRANIPNANQKSARVCMGQNYETGSIFILTCGGWEAEQGMYSHTAGEILAGYGCNVAVELCSGADACATDKGAMMFTPDGGKVPQLFAYWYVSRKCSFTSDFQEEIAKLMQKYGQTLHNLKLHELRLNAIDEVLQDHEQRLEVAEEKLVALEAEILIINERISVLETQINEVFERIIILETALNALTIRVENVENDVSKLQSDLLKEIQDRIAGDEGLQAQINSIMSAIASINELILAINATLVTLIQSVTELKNQVLQLEIRVNEHESRIMVLEQSGGGDWNEARITAIENKNTEQDGRLDALEAGGTGGDWDEARIVTIEQYIDTAGTTLYNLKTNYDIHMEHDFERNNRIMHSYNEIFGSDGELYVGNEEYTGLKERVEILENNGGGTGGDWDEPRISTIENDVDDLQGRVQLLEEVEENDGVLISGYLGNTNIPANTNFIMPLFRTGGADIIENNAVIIPENGYYHVAMQGGYFSPNSAYSGAIVVVNGAQKLYSVISNTTGAVPSVSGVLQLNAGDRITFEVRTVVAVNFSLDPARSSFTVMRAISNVGEIGNNWDESRIAAIENENLLQGVELADLDTANITQNARIEIAENAILELENAVEALENADTNPTAFLYPNTNLPRTYLNGYSSGGGGASSGPGNAKLMVHLTKNGVNSTIDLKVYRHMGVLYFEADGRKRNHGNTEDELACQIIVPPIFMPIITTNTPIILGYGESGLNFGFIIKFNRPLNAYEFYVTNYPAGENGNVCYANFSSPALFQDDGVTYLNETMVNL